MGIPAFLMPVIEELRSSFQRLEQLGKAQAAEWAHRRKLGLGVIPWDDARLYTVATSGTTDANLMSDWRRMAVRIKVVDAAAGATVAFNGGDDIPVAEGDDFPDARVSRLIMKAGGSGQLQVAVFLALGNATGTPWPVGPAEGAQG